MAEKSLKIFFYAMDGIGHINACVGLAQALAKRSHKITFLTNLMFSGKFKEYGFDEIILNSTQKQQMMSKSGSDEERKIHPLKVHKELLIKLRETGMLSGKPSIEKLRHHNPNDEEGLFKKMLQESIEYQPQIEKLLNEHQPDLIIVDHFQVPPCIYYGKYCWAFLFSGNPSFIFQSPDLPPICSGYPSNGDRQEWEKFRIVMKDTFYKSFHETQNALFKHFGYPEIDDPNHFLSISPHMNIYGYPEELDYTDIIKRPENFVQLDTFCLEYPEPFEFPEEFRKKLKPDDRLVYVSMGSMGCIDVDLMKRLVKILADSPYKFVVSMGPLSEEYELANNMWGLPYLPQTKILPMVHMVITHGGNNTVTETFYSGKPMLVSPLFADQYDNAQRILEKGYGGRINAYTCTEDELRQEVDRIMNDQEIRRKCEMAAKRIKDTDCGKPRACGEIEGIVKKFQQKQKQQ